jgi:hypothetical protein
VTTAYNETVGKSLLKDFSDSLNRSVYVFYPAGLTGPASATARLLSYLLMLRRIDITEKWG